MKGPAGMTGRPIRPLHADGRAVPVNEPGRSRALAMAIWYAVNANAAVAFGFDAWVQRVNFDMRPEHNSRARGARTRCLRPVPSPAMTDAHTPRDRSPATAAVAVNRTHCRALPPA